MTLVNNSPMKKVYESYLLSRRYYGYRSLWDCYERPSYAKERALEYCRELEAKYNGYNATIIGYNTSTFSYGFMFEKDGKTYFAYITKSYDRYIEV